MEPHEHPKRNAIVKIIAAVAVIGLAGFAFSRIDSVKKEDSIDNSLTSTTSTKENIEPVTEGRSKYVNGSYDATGNYSSPAGREEIFISLVLKDDIVVSGTFVGKATNPGSVKNQTLFKGGFDQYVIGKNIDSLSLQVVNGSSLTPKGFMDALLKIKAEAITS